MTPEQIDEWRVKIKNKIWSDFCAEPNEEHGRKLMAQFDALCDLALQAHTARSWDAKTFDALVAAGRAAQDQRGAADGAAGRGGVAPQVGSIPTKDKAGSTPASAQSAPHQSSPPQASPRAVPEMEGSDHKPTLPAAGGDFVPCASCGSAWCKEHRQCLQGRAAGGGHGWITGTADVDAMNAADEAAPSSPPQDARVRSAEATKLAAGGDRMTRAQSSRLYRFLCWLWFGHDRVVAGKSAGICGRCGQSLFGSD